nr:uncharacterized protein LOC128692568 [Cherax quadricarinatus]
MVLRKESYSLSFGLLKAGEHLTKSGVGGGEGSLDTLHHPWLSSTSGGINTLARINTLYSAPNVEKQKLMLAVHAVAEGLMTGRQAAKAFSVPRTTLRRWMAHDRRLFPCPHCSYCATERSHLRKHIASRHREITSYIPPAHHIFGQNLCLSPCRSILQDHPSQPIADDQNT